MGSYGSHHQVKYIWIKESTAKAKKGTSLQKVVMPKSKQGHCLWKETLLMIFPNVIHFLSFENHKQIPFTSRPLQFGGETSLNIEYLKTSTNMTENVCMARYCTTRSNIVFGIWEKLPFKYLKGMMLSIKHWEK